MEQLFPVIFVAALIAFLLMKQIGHITGNLDLQGERGGMVDVFTRYSQFSVAIQNHIRAIKLDIDSTKKIENPRYILSKGVDEEDSVELLSDFLRRLVFFETLLAKKKSPDEIESELFGVLSELDSFVKKSCEDGEFLAEELKENLLSQYERS